MNSHSKYTSKDVVIKYINHNPDVFTSYNDIYTIFLQDQKTQKIFEKPIIETFLTIDFQNVIDRTAIIVENSA